MEKQMEKQIGGNDQHQVTFHFNSSTEKSNTNQIKSTSSTILTFIPLNLLHQFRNLPNSNFEFKIVYFLFISLLQTIPSISITEGRPVMLIPLSFVIITVMVKDAYEQYMRYEKDKEENNRPVQILTPSGFRQDVWENIRSGQIIKLVQNDLIPCDALILCTNLPNNKCFLQTKSLDGQTSLKIRKAPQSKIPFHKMHPTQLAKKDYQVVCQKPNPALGKLKGFTTLEKETVPISIQNALLRGCNLRNCKQAVCIALYVGSETKVILNSSKFNAKKSNLMREIDKIMLKIFVFQVLLSLSLALLNILLERKHTEYIKHLGFSRLWTSAASWWLLMTSFVPISLVVTMQMVKLFQGKVIKSDRRGYSEQYDCFINANNTSINQNLGQIKYVFSDKTGTLTKNQMNFKKVVAGGIQYGSKLDLTQQKIKSNFPSTSNVKFADSDFFNNLEDPKIKEVLSVLFLCHDVIIEKGQAGYSYNSSSPDEIALINFAKMCGYELIQAEETYIKIFHRQSNTVLKFEKLAFLHFTSDRKRMSVIVRLPGNKIELLMKGADLTVEKRLRPNQPSQPVTEKLLQKFSIQGLRTLVLARRQIQEQQFAPWYADYMKAKSLILDREIKLQEVYEKIEKDLFLVGGTAVEDCLQDNVCQTIVMMKNAEIKFFILTGDKKQTAVSIGRACGLVSPFSKLFSIPEQRIQGQKYEGEKVYLIDASQTINQYPIDIFNHQTICYRCTPNMKQNIVKYIKEHSNDLTLAIGDGANDVNMILQADVGVGVKGHEGTEAARVADFVVGEYKQLAFLTLYYGRQWYRKNCSLICYNFFKNWYHVTAMISYGAFSYFSAILIYDIYNRQFFNVFYSSLPIIIFSVFDEEYTWQQSKVLPEIYKPGLNNAEFNSIAFFKCIGQATLYGTSSMLTIFMFLQSEVLTKSGQTGYMWQSGAVLMFSIIMVVNFKVIAISTKLSLGLVITVSGSFMMYWIIYFAQTKILKHFKLEDSFKEEWERIPIYLMHIILITVFAGIEYVYRKIKRYDYKRTRYLSKYLSQNAIKNVIPIQE